MTTMLTTMMVATVGAQRQIQGRHPGAKHLPWCQTHRSQQEMLSQRSPLVYAFKRMFCGRRYRGTSSSRSSRVCGSRTRLLTVPFVPWTSLRMRVYGGNGGGGYGGGYGGASPCVGVARPAVVTARFECAVGVAAATAYSSSIKQQQRWGWMAVLAAEGRVAHAAPDIGWGMGSWTAPADGLKARSRSSSSCSFT
jgi:hypothetical protein